jgi:hypothetical protein
VTAAALASVLALSLRHPLSPRVSRRRLLPSPFPAPPQPLGSNPTFGNAVKSIDLSDLASTAVASAFF